MFVVIFRFIYFVNGDIWKYLKFKVKKLGIFFNLKNNLVKIKFLKLGRFEW